MADFGARVLGVVLGDLLLAGVAYMLGFRLIRLVRVPRQRDGEDEEGGACHDDVPRRR
jgi:hypothetical protein